MKKKPLLKTLVIYVLLGADLGAVIASYAVPPALSWYSEPAGLPQGTQIQALVEIPKVIQYATGKLIQWQLIGASLGAIAGLVLCLLLRRRASRPAEPPVTPAPPPSADAAVTSSARRS